MKQKNGNPPIDITYHNSYYKGAAMSYPALKLHHNQPYLAYGEVVETIGERYVVSVQSGEVDARVALSCIVQPEPGDLVMISLDDFNRCYVVAVLERDTSREQPIGITFPSDVTMTVEHGGLTIRTEDSLQFGSRKEISLSTEDLNIHATNGDVCMEKLSFIGKYLGTQVEKVKIVGNTLDTVFKRMTQKIKHGFRYIEHHEEVHAGSSRYLIKETMTVQSKNSIHLAREHMKLDAEQIHIG